MEPDVVVVGGGAAGLSAATTVAAAGRPVVLVSDGPLGGDCTWHGCVPSKALLAAAAAGLGPAAAVSHARRSVEQVARTEHPGLLGAAGVDVVRARVRLRAGDGVPGVVADDGRRWSPRAGVVLATGSRPVPSVPGLHPAPDVRVSTTDGWLDALGQHLGAVGPGGTVGPVVVVGGGASGVELAQALGRLGLPTTLLERAPALLPGLPGAGEVLTAALGDDGVAVRCSVTSEEVSASVGPDALVLLCAGREPGLDALDGWDGPPLAVGAGGVAVDGQGRTSVPGLLAAGDVTGLSPSTHVSAAAGRVAAATLLGQEAALDVRWAPRVVWTDPEVAAVGAVPAVGDAPVVGIRHVRVPLSRTDRARLEQVPGGRRPRGSVQLWVGGDDRLRGALAVGPHAVDLVAEVALVGRLGIGLREWVGGVPGVGATVAHHAYPSWSWLWREAADRLLGR